jgi:hypothetical protein
MREAVSRIVNPRFLLIGSLVLMFHFVFAYPSLVVRADSVSDWNATTVSTTLAAGKNPILQSRIYAMTQAAIHDALNSIDARYHRCALQIPADPAASPDAAVAAAAYRVLIHELPAQQASLDAWYANALAAIPAGQARSSGVAIGQAAAAAILTLRNSDGSTANVPYTPGTGPGAWQPTPPAGIPALLPGWGRVTPFVLHSGSQYRPDPPAHLDLSSRKYEKDYNEVKSVGAANSDTRSAVQSEIARYWYEGSPTGWNRIARVVSAARGLDQWESARLFALVHLAMADGFIAGGDAKYTYNFWRPVTAIRAGETDGNPRTTADPAWNPFLITPPTPDYPSTHSVLGAAAAEVLKRFFNRDDVSFTMTSGAPFPDISRSFTSFSEAAQENADSRVYAGIHYRTTCEDGLKLGRKVGKFTFRHSLKPIR